MSTSTLTKKQNKTFCKKRIVLDGQRVDIYVNVRYDDHCGNGHNSFAITADIYRAGSKHDNSMIIGGCCRDEIIKFFPELAKYIKWHFMNSDGPMYYLANSQYHVNGKDCSGYSDGEPINLEAGRSCAIWPEATVENILDTNKMNARLPALMEEFKDDLIELGLVY